ncbi:hypothetical protein JL09_g6169 [Pichia kudriavzevii]|uniref:Uncharacterized protein n=1 Tax=Pichia kudriavzevii TaxID=4909 RepID=A0A099NRW4_PICKU|nr:hypothetical protein JL09_g6169 [Pichia kudriavzevii]
MTGTVKRKVATEGNSRLRA